MTIFSGIQPTGKFHIGNYLGAVKQWVKLQKNNQCFFCVVDLHAITIPYKPQELQEKVFKSILYLIASGVNPQKTILFIQSAVSEHTELAWLLGVATAIGDLQRMHQYKEKVKKFKKNANAGLLNYPILQAADILLYDTDLVPIGKDQIQHIELARAIAKRFNSKFKTNILKIPKAQVPKNEAKIMALNNPTKKMSKSEPKGCIFLDDNENTITSKIMSSVTDSDNKIEYDPINKPGVSNLLIIYSSINNISLEETVKRFNKGGYSQFKKETAKALADYLKPIRTRLFELEKDEPTIRKMITTNNQKAKNIAQQKLNQIKRVMGLI